MAIANENVFGRRGDSAPKTKWKKGETRVSGDWRQVWNGKKWVSTKRVDKDEPSSGGGSGNAGGTGGGGPIVVGPYDRDYLNASEFRREQQRRATEAVEPISAIEARSERELAGAEAIGKTFQQMLMEQQAQNAAVLQAIGGGGTGAGSALTTGALTGALQEGAYAPRYAAGQTAESIRGVQQRESEARQRRSEDFRKYLAQAGADLRTEEKEKQAARIEREAAAKAYGIDLAELQAKERAAAQKQSNWERRYELDLAKFQASDETDTGKILSMIDDTAKQVGISKGAGDASVTLSWTDLDGKRQSENVSGIKIPYNPKTASPKVKQQFWSKVLRDQLGVNPDEIDSAIGVSNYTRSDVARKPVDVAKYLIDVLSSAYGYSSRDAASLLLRSVWGASNARAVQTAAGG